LTARNKTNGKPRRLPSSTPLRETVRRAFQMLSPRRRLGWFLLIPLAVIGAAFEALVAVATYVLLKHLADPSATPELPGASGLTSVLPGFSTGFDVQTFIALLAVCFVTKNVFVLIVELVHHFTVQRSVAELSRRMLDGYLRAPYALHLSRNSADLIRNVTSAVDAAFSPVLGSAVQVLTESLIALGLVAVLMAASPGITLLSLAILVLGVTPLLLLTRGLVTRWGAREHQMREVTLKLLQQALGGIKEAKTLGLEDFFGAAFANCANTMATLRYRFMTLNAAPRLVIETTMIAGMLGLMALVLSWGQPSNELLSLFGLYGYAAFRLIPSANRITMHLNQIRHGGPAILDLYHDFSDLEPAAYEPSSGASSEVTHDLCPIAFEGVSFSYSGASVEAIDGVSLTILRGECIGIAGATGAGKSTLVDLMLGLLSPSEGRVTAGGKDTASLPRELRRQLGYVPQHIYLTDDTLARNVAFGVPDPDIDRDRVQTVIEQAQLSEFVGALPAGLDTLLGERGTRLSGGERQRVGIARALYRDPLVVLFDEATSALDNRTERDVMRALSNLRQGKTLVLIAHRLSTIQSCDRLFFLQAGKVAASGSYEQLLRECEGFRALVESAETSD
jgi:ATP-binding cassette subfamily C protein